MEGIPSNLLTFATTAFMVMEGHSPEENGFASIPGCRRF